MPLLFSYGSLQQRAVQPKALGRTMTGADIYERTFGYRRQQVALESGRLAWVYVHVPELLR